MAADSPTRAGIVPLPALMLLAHGRFTGFPKTGLDFLATLSKKDKTWFDADRATCETDVVGSAKAFVAAIGEALADRISPAIEAPPKTNGSIHRWLVSNLG